MQAPKIILMIVLGLIYTGLNGQSFGLEELFFRTISPQGGFTDKGVEHITKDQLGFIWIGTRDGLYRYDGYEFSKYNHVTGDSTSLSNDGISDLVTDNQKRLWIATEDGLNLYNRADNAFQRIVPGDAGPTGSISDLEPDGRGVLYIGCERGIIKYDHGSGSSELITLPHQDIRNIQLGENGKLLVSFVENGIWQVDPAGNHSVLVEKGESSLRTFLLTYNRMYLGYETEGVFIHDLDGQYIAELNSENGSVCHNKINKILRDSYGNIWIGTYLGLDIMDPEGNMHHYTHDNLDPNSIPYSSVYEIFEDPGRNFWVGTWSGGLAYYNQYDNNFRSHRHLPGINSLSNNYVSCFTVDLQGDLWIGTERGGLNRRESSSGIFSQIPIRQDVSEDLNIKSLCSIRDGRIIVGTYKGGCYILGKSREIERILLEDIEAGNEKVYAIQESSSGLWIGDFNQGLYLLSGSDYSVKSRYMAGNGPYGLTSSKISTLYLTEENLWIGTSNGLNLLHGDTRTVSRFKHERDNPASLSSNRITMITADLEGRIWIGTRNGGLNMYREEAGTFIKYTMEDGLSGNDVNGILCDESGYLWISTENGISRFDPDDGSVLNYNVSDGLQGNQFNPGSAYRDMDGKLFFGGTNGYTMIQPSKIKSNPLPPQPIITKLIINNQEMLASIPGSPLSASISESSQITLKKDQSSLSLNFSANSYLNPSKNRFAFRLLGMHDIWQYTYSNQVSYSNLDAGRYIFELLASNNDGIWSNESVTLDIRILPPWWGHPVAILAYVLFGVVALILTRYQILYRERMKLAVHMETLRRENEANIHKLKLQYFTNISHEFKTPLTLILSPIQRLVQEKDLDPQVKEDLQLALKNAIRLKRIVNQFIEFRKIDQVKLKLHICKIDLVGLCEEIYSCFTELAEQRKIDYSFNQLIEPVDIWIDVEKVENALFNVLSNAFKYTGIGGQIQISLRKGASLLPPGWKQFQLGEIHDDLVLEISDTGPGIREDELEHIFERFYRSEESPVQTGSGIGLSLARDYILLHHGFMKVASSPGEGSSFIVGLPLGKKHFEGDTNVLIADQERLPIQQRPDVLPEELVSTSEDVSEPGRDRTSILLIEDNQDLNQYLTRVLSEEYKVVNTTDGKEGLALASRLLPELILTDILLPGMDGLELCRQVKTNPLTSHIPIILITALSDDNQHIKGIETGADAYLTKPLDVQLLSSTIHNLIEARKKLRLAYGGMKAATSRDEGLSAFDDNLVRRAKVYVENNITNPDISTTQLASELSMSRTNLHRKLKSLTGKSTTEFIRNIRIYQAMTLIEQENLPISDVCYSVGFTSTSYFSKCFKEIYGISPSAFKRNFTLKKQNDPGI